MTTPTQRIVAAAEALAAPLRFQDPDNLSVDERALLEAFDRLAERALLEAFDRLAESPAAEAVFGPDELAEVEARAEAATAGPWMASDPNEGTEYGPHWHVHNNVYVNPHLEDEGQAGFGAVIELGWQDDAAFIAAARTDVPRLAEALRSAWAERDQHGPCVALVDTNAEMAQLRLDLKAATDRADLLNDALADAARHIGDSDALNRANAVLRADTDANLSPRHRDAMGRPQFCDDAQADLSNHRTWIDDADAALQQALGDRWSPDRPIAAGVQALAGERDQAQAELARLVEDSDEVFAINNGGFIVPISADDAAAIKSPATRAQMLRALQTPWQPIEEGDGRG